MSQGKWEKIYCGNGKKDNQSQYEKIVFKINLDKIPEECIFHGKKGKYIDIHTSPLQQRDQYGNEFSAYCIRPAQPAPYQPREGEQAPPQNTEKWSKELDEENIPF